jgi:hypothetical protein
MEWKVCPSPSLKLIGLNFLSHQYGIAIAICANFQTPNFKGSACAGLQAFDLKCPLEAFGGQIQHFYCIQKSFIPKRFYLDGAKFVIIILSNTKTYIILQFYKSSKAQLLLSFVIYVLPVALPTNWVWLYILNLIEKCKFNILIPK